MPFLEALDDEVATDNQDDDDVKYEEDYIKKLLGYEDPGFADPDVYKRFTSLEEFNEDEDN